ncbi:MAG TPA: ABC transporter permease [Gemmatimonadales bacterium]|jgi:predicted permease
MRIEHWWYTLPLRLRSLFRHAAVERDDQDELNDHIAAQVATYQRHGMTPVAARTAALRDLGGLERRREELRATRGTGPIEHLLRDVRYAIRTLCHAPAFTAIVVVTLAVGAGANAAIFTIVDAVILRPLPYGHADGLMVIDHQSGGNAVPAELIRWRREASSAFTAIGGAVVHTATLTGRGDAEQVNQLSVSANIFPMMQVAPLLGRTFTPEEEHDGTRHRVILSYAFWHTRFGENRGILGQALLLDGQPYTVVGVMPRGFLFAPYWAVHNDLWTPLFLDGGGNDWDTAAYRVFARLRPGVSVTQAGALMTRIAAATKIEHPKADAPLQVTPLRDRVVRSVRTELWILLSAVMLVLLIACANVSHLQLMRAAAREREASVRLALGAGRARLAQQSLIESLLLALAGAALGLVLAVFGVRALVALAPPAIPRLDDVHINVVVFGFLALVACGAGVLSGLIPALAAARVDPASVLKQSGRGGDSARRRRIGRLLVISEFAMAVILLVGAMLVMRSFAAMEHVDPGFDARHVRTMQVAVRGSADDALARREPFFNELLNRIRALPGVEAASAINHLPLHGDTWRFGFWTQEHPLATGENQPSAFFRLVRPDYFRTMGIAVVRGRDITTSDAQARAHVVIVDQHLAAATWPGDDPIGHQLTIDDPSTGPEWFTVIGVVRNVQQADWGAAREGEMFFPYWRSDSSGATGRFTNLLTPSAMTLVVRTRGDGAATEAAVRKVVTSLDRDAPVADVISMQHAVDEQVAEPRFYLALLSGFALVALLLAAIGVYGVMSHAVASRVREIAIRLALGAPRSVPLRLALEQGLALAVAGTLTGIVAALALTRFLQGLLFDVAPTDPVTFIAIPLLLLFVAAWACVVPALRAARTDPMRVLRLE